MQMYFRYNIYNGKIVVGTYSIYTPNIKLCTTDNIGRNKVTVSIFV